jgi:hypothetical protein
MTAAAYTRPATATATLTAYEANCMDALVRTALEYGVQTVAADVADDADNGDDSLMQIAARAPRAVVNRYTATDTDRRNADTWNAVMRAAWAARYDRAR